MPRGRRGGGAVVCRGDKLLQTLAGRGWCAQGDQGISRCIFNKGKTVLGYLLGNALTGLAKGWTGDAVEWVLPGGRRPAGWEEVSLG